MNQGRSSILFAYGGKEYMIALVMIFLFSCNQRNERIWIPLNNDIIQENHGITKTEKKLTIPLVNNGEQVFLMIENPHINDIAITDMSDTILYKSGDNYPFGQRPIKHRFFIFPLKTIQKADTIKVTLDKKGENLSYIIRLFNQDTLDEFLKTDFLMTGAILGFYILAIMIVLVMMANNFSPKYIFFFLYMLLSLLWILNDGGFFYELLWPDSPIWHKSSRGFFSSISMILFACYLYKNDNRMLTHGIKKVTIVLIGLLSFKFLLSVIFSNGPYPESIKSISMYFNAISLLTLFGGISIYLMNWLYKTSKDRFEILGILTYCFFVISLSSKEIGLSLLGDLPIHHFDAMLFFPFQCLFMATHLYLKEKERKKAAENDLIFYKIEQGRFLDRKILEVEENEKKRISQNIHDEIGGIFVALKYQIRSLKEKLNSEAQKEQAEGLIKLSEEGIRKQYSIIDDLLLEFKSDHALKESIDKQIQLMLSREDIRSNFIFNTDETKWTDFQKTQVFRIVTELITNTIKHANATDVNLEITGTKAISMTYEDNGKGFDLQSLTEGRGLSNINMRINALDGKKTCQSGKHGTVFHFTFDLKHE